MIVSPNEPVSTLPKSDLRSASATSRDTQPIWPLAVIVFGVVLTVAWLFYLIFGVAKVIWLTI